MRLFGILAAAIFAAGAFAGDPFYLGTWKIASAVVAPWWDSPGQPDASESKALVGKTVLLKPVEIVGPGLLSCKGPKYKLVSVPAEGLFQGAFDEMHRTDKSIDPLKMAAKVGFRGTSWKSLQTGCANEIDFHFVNATTAEFGLNNYVFILKKR
jgi:hypothetical protein